MTTSAATDLVPLRETIVGLSSNPSDISDLLTILSNNSTLISSNALSLYESLCPNEHTIACMYILWEWATGHIGRETDYIRCASHFLKNCNRERISFPQGKFLVICRHLKSIIMLMEAPRLGVLPFFNAATKFAQTPESLTPLHVEFLQICLLAKTYSAAEPFLKREFYDLNPTISGLTSTEYLLYCYYGGRLCTGLKWYPRALEILRFALVAPTLVTNAITVMIYKHFILVSLLEYDTVPDLPKFASGAVLRLSRSAPLNPYLRLADAYKNDEVDKVQSTADEFRNVFMEDNCLGLVKQVLSKLTKRDIKRLTKVYISLSLEDITSTVGLSSVNETQQILLAMVQEKEINVEINSMTGMVKFLDDVCSYDDVSTSLELDHLVNEVTLLTERMQNVKDQIELDPEYLAKVFQNKQHSRLDENDMAARM